MQQSMHQCKRNQWTHCLPTTSVGYGPLPSFTHKVCFPPHRLCQVPTLILLAHQTAGACGWAVAAHVTHTIPWTFQAHPFKTIHARCGDTLVFEGAADSPHGVTQINQGTAGIEADGAWCLAQACLLLCAVHYKCVYFELSDICMCLFKLFEFSARVVLVFKHASACLALFSLSLADLLRGAVCPQLHE